MKQLNAVSLRVVLIAIVVVLPAVAFLWLHLASPSDGARMEPGLAVWRSDGVVLTALGVQANGLRPGDVLVAVDGTSVESWAKRLFDLRVSRPQWHFDQTVTYTVVRQGHQLNIPVSLGHYPLSGILLEDWGTILYALVTLLVAMFVFLYRPNDRQARLLLLGASSLLAATTWSFGLQVSDLADGIGFWLYQATTYGGYQLFWAAGLHFSLAFAYPHSRLLVATTRVGAVSTLEWLGRWASGQGIITLVYLLLSLVAFFRGYRASRDAVTRQKLRWVVFAGLVSGISGIILWVLPTDILGFPIISNNVLGLLVVPFPLSIAIAILRHRLFDIDIIIHRTLVYSILSGALALVYFGSVVMLHFLFGGLTGQNNGLVIAGSTLGIAALFQPLRRYIQAVIDRRFYRHKYDAAKTLEAFGATLRNEVNLNTLREQLVAVVEETMQPAHVSLWLRKPEKPGERNTRLLPSIDEEERVL